MNTKIQQLEKELAEEKFKVNRDKLDSLLADNGGVTGYRFDIGGNELGCYDCSINIYCKNNTIVRIWQKGGRLSYGEVESQFKKFINRYWPAGLKTVEYNYNEQKDYKELVFKEI